ncbi:hypothetical protein JTE90_002368 [Oedothorax gibbosus]|uniref:Guanine nucleotide-binding protein-like 3 homolog n=1 Tax=Oedothorax gibbosus TaxID=931172 RepID=A0AAV6VEM1_9ARAC|nr:hypothetical protein JTE90_002368 [Oedothorax gibbosus]
MPKFHRKQSKRKPCRLRYKIIKKVAEHNRKLRREQKKNPSHKKPKDPGVPNSLPFKDEILQEAEQRKRQALDLKEAQKASRLKIQMENKNFDEMIAEAQKIDEEFKDNGTQETTLKENSHNVKSYFRELKNVVEQADVILEVLDSRDPLGSRCPQIEELVIKSGKKLVLVLNKIDLIPRKNLDEWLKYLRQSLPTVAFKASTQSQNTNLSQSKTAAIHITESLQASSRCVGASFLMKVLGNYCRNNDIQTFIKVGVVGFPNVGKSSVINSLKRSRSCSVGATPGLTKTVQEVSLDKHIKIIDSPGVVLAKDGSSTTLALRNAVKVETLKDVIGPAEAIIQRADPVQLCLHYTIPEFKSSDELLALLAKRMGKYKKGGIPNVEEGARRLINDWNKGVIKYYTHPPEQFDPAVYLSTEIVSELSKAFDISALEEGMELDKAPELFASRGVVAKPSLPTEGIASEEMATDNQEENTEEEKMDEEIVGQPKQKRVSFNLNENFAVDDKKITVEVKGKKGTKKGGKKAEAPERYMLAEHQQNKVIKQKFKQSRKNKKRMNKAAKALLSESMESAPAL